MSKDWKTIGKEKADSVFNSIPKEWRIDKIPSIEEQPDVTGSFVHQYLSKQEIEITETDAVGIVMQTSSGRWKSVDVAKAFCHRAAVAHQLVNCLHEFFYDDALQAAEFLDKYYSEHKKPLGPLHGLPVSLKDQFHVKGVETSMGYIGWLGTFQGKKDSEKYKTYESLIVKDLKSLGAILFVKTSVPHTLMAGETVNNIIGFTRNPKNRNLSSGGSSGGEGALIGLRGSPVGFGTDIGGSIRIPSAFNGLYGCRPSTGRMPYEGMANSMDGQNGVLSVVGPLATSPDALKLVMQAILTKKPWFHDPLCHEMPWRSNEEAAIWDPIERFSQPLSFGVVRHDGNVAPHPPVARAVDIVVKAMEKLGHNVIDWDPKPTHEDLCNITYKCWGFDGGKDCRDDMALVNEPLAPQALIPDTPQANAMDIMKTIVEKREAQKEYMEYWNASRHRTGTGRPVDAIIAPLAPFAAARENGYTYYNYSVWVNMVDYTSVVIPVTHADKSVDKKDTNFKAKGDVDQKTHDLCRQIVATPCLNKSLTARR